jgi:hypothetical protein
MLLSSMMQTILGRLDCSDPQVEEIVAGEKIDGYPTIMVYKRGERIGEYHGNRTERLAILSARFHCTPRHWRP